MTPENRDVEGKVRHSYELVPYAAAAQHHTHPDRLATLARLHGLTPALPERCRVLELGCANGANLIPMAMAFPESRFVGIDLSPRQIEEGRAELAELGIENVELRAMSILDFDASFGTFDYILCHGVFSWVTPDVQERILAIVRAQLAPQGLAYISYNTYPGWHLRRMLREMLLFHTRGIDEPELRAAKAFELVAVLADAAGDAQDPHAVYLRGAREHLEEYRDQPSYVLHEYLEETNAPLYFRDFAWRASRHGLQYVSEAEAHEAEVDNLPANVAQQLRAFASDRIELEQYLDFVLNRTFRRTLLAHGERALDRTMRPETMRALYAASPSKPQSAAPDLRTGMSESFHNERGKPFSSSHPVAKATLVALAAAWPGALSLDELASDVHRRLRAAGAPDDADEVLPDLLHALFWSGVVLLHTAAPLCTSVVSEHPRATPFARREAARGLLVTNQRGRVLKFDDPLARTLLLQLDGTRDRAALVRFLDAEAAAGRLDIHAGGTAIPDPSRIPSVLEALVEHHLKRMAELALLVS
ncbi:MAG: methyltransferase regulatory domain-containing protein [Acidobacteria bacterium]|nr:methyltransferase regulatory domain-containing protein [Acidobacteriota bacterium]MBV9475023.1 methyltransferase regulatory domain-containing protein [Acidobacteriota bacterium]